MASIGPSAEAVGPYPSLGSCQVFPNPPASLSPRAPSLPTEAAWNQDISKAPRDPRSAAYIAYIDSHGGDHLHPDFGSPRPYGFPFSVVDSGQPLLPIHYTAYGDESDPGPFPVPAKAPVEGGNGSDGDRHVLVVDRSACKLYELYRAFYVAKPRPHWNADSGTEWDLRSAARRPEGWTSADAAGLPIFPGLVRYDEAVTRGLIDHAVRFTCPRTRRAFVAPARHYASSDTSSALPPMGMRVRLKSSYDVSTFPAEVQVILRGLKKYGMILADNGTGWYITGAPDPRWDDDRLG
ncbi:MAG TPA: hypothetical protein VFJ61_01805, partial [Solirubrobacterales bacterium]|nr:hypothetical protein [Solirubrobacterales bacterium]